MAKATSSYFALDSAVDRVLFFRDLKKDAAVKGLDSACEKRGIPCRDEAGEYLPQGLDGSYKAIEADVRGIQRNKAFSQKIRDAAKDSLAIRAKRMTTTSGPSIDAGDESRLDDLFGEQEAA